MYNVAYWTFLRQSAEHIWNTIVLELLQSTNYSCHLEIITVTRKKVKINVAFEMFLRQLQLLGFKSTFVSVNKPYHIKMKHAKIIAVLRCKTWSVNDFHIVKVFDVYKWVLLFCSNLILSTKYNKRAFFIIFYSGV